MTGDRWQPIETAPKNGDPILIGDAKTGSIRWAVWSDGFWRDGQVEAGGRICGCPVPTHWMLLPKPPRKPRTYDIVTEYEPHFGWIATDDKTYDGPPCPIGHGETEIEAIADLMEQLEE